MSNIEWTDSTWNPIIGCAKVAQGCKHCYAETMSKRLAAMGQKDYASILTPDGKFNGRAITRPETLAEPLRWKKPRMVFVNSMSDLFHEDAPFEYIAAVFGVMAACPQHTFQVLTKRPERALEFFEWIDTNALDVVMEKANDIMYSVAPALQTWIMPGDRWPLKNVWLGVSIATQADADKNIPILLKCPAAVRFVSAEPLIEAVDFSDIGDALFDRKASIRAAMYGPMALNAEQADSVIAEPELDWVIVGGESGPGARPCDVAWIRSIVEQCKAASVPCFVKQMGANVFAATKDTFGRVQKALALGNVLSLKDRKGVDPSEWPEGLRVRQFPARPQ
jgi:protein gp37